MPAPHPSEIMGPEQSAYCHAHHWKDVVCKHTRLDYVNDRRHLTVSIGTLRETFFLACVEARRPETTALVHCWVYGVLMVLFLVARPHVLHVFKSLSPAYALKKTTTRRPVKSRTRYAPANFSVTPLANIGSGNRLHRVFVLTTHTHPPPHHLVPLLSLMNMMFCVDATRFRPLYCKDTP